jgi:hypothetical protein
MFQNSHLKYLYDSYTYQDEMKRIQCIGEIVLEHAVEYEYV